MINNRWWMLITIAILIGGAQGSLWAQGESEDWQWRAAVYGWFPDLEAKTQFPSGAGGPTINVDASTLVDNLDFTFQASLQGRKGAWVHSPTSSTWTKAPADTACAISRQGRRHCRPGYLTTSITT